jgi:hypothetical protein
MDGDATGAAFTNPTVAGWRAAATTSHCAGVGVTLGTTVGTPTADPIVLVARTGLFNGTSVRTTAGRAVWFAAVVLMGTAPLWFVVVASTAQAATAAATPHALGTVQRLAFGMRPCRIVDVVDAWRR